MGRHAGALGLTRPAVRNAKRQYAVLRARMAPSAEFVWALYEDSSGTLWAGAQIRALANEARSSKAICDAENGAHWPE